MKHCLKLTLLLILVLNFRLYCQQDIADSLSKQLNLLSGEKKVDVLNELADIYQYINTKTAIEYASKGVELASEINYDKGLAGSYGSLGYCYINLDNNKALNFTQKALDIRRRINDKAGIATSFNVLGVINYYTGNYLTSIEYHLEALKLREEVGDEVRMATSYNNIALVYLTLGDYETSLDYLQKALAVRIKTDNKRGIGIIKDNIGNIYGQMGKYDLAFAYLNEALIINKEIGNKKSEANSYYNMAKSYRDLKDNANAFKYFQLSLDIYLGLDEKHGIASTENGIASIYRIEGKTDQAIEHALTAMGNAELINSISNISAAADILQFSYEKSGDHKKAYEYLKVFQNSSDSIKVTEKIKKLAKIEFDYKIKKFKEAQEAELNQQKIFIQTLGITLFLLLIIVFLIVREIRRKKEINTTLNDLNVKLQELNSTKDRFFSIIAHDLRGPFQVLLGFSNILVSDVDNLSKEDIKNYSKGLNVSLQKQFDLLNDLLNWSRLQNGSFQLKPEAFFLHKELNDIMEPLALTAAQKNIRLVNDIDENISVYADKNMLRLVLRNLISNSIKFTELNGYAKVTALQNENMIEITVADNGVGISDSAREKIFRIDTHHSTKGTTNEMGTGLGLILCKEIVEKHSGNIYLESELNKGTKVIFTLPSKEI